MLITTCALAALAAPTAAALPPTPVAPSVARASDDEHGKLPWFEGTWEELLAEAKTSGKMVFLDFWTDW